MQDLKRPAPVARSLPGWLPEIATDGSDPAEPAAACHALKQGLYGACSVETFRAAGSLNAAHRDAGGFLDGVDRYATADFWRRDGLVQSWIFARPEAAPAAQGLDDVRVFYHAGHGAMDEAGVFHLPMGAMWAGADASLASTRMRFGAEKLRYMFWSASESLRVAEGHSPMRSWALANRGLRMMFGFESASWDSGSYGRNFWRHWARGKGFAQAWLDGAADVAQDQVAVACAMGGTRDEAQARLFGESRFRPAPSGRDWWMWRWRQPLTQYHRDPVTQVSRGAARVRLVAPDQDLHLIGAVLAALDLDPDSLPPPPAPHLPQKLSLPGLRVLRCPRGTVMVDYGRGSRGGRGRVAVQKRALLGRAWSALRRHGFLRAGYDLCFDGIALSLSAGRCLRPDGESLPETCDDIIVQFRQVIDGIPVITPDLGRVRVTLRPDGSLLRIEADLRRPALAHHPIPPEAAPLSDTSHGGSAVRDALAREGARLMRDLAARGAAPLTLRVLPGMTEIGYAIRSNTARLVARQGIEICCVRGYRKRYWIQSDLGD
ncbi:DUF6345 domain-containing protein [Paracoccus shanxieyensis]|uniref:Uncharacterized protein n=1 Tax=Paracoccus shanxieyensis TaxID=2675752 RepID=A0A6L6ITP0_9RHOB|nr:DUF6345 domain-containing protein [Paracoccus shanxieyensis]MTH63816.1 hypothetical protein [Paracoccus shanxieyensis]MTH86673.1 hypothetical protein [Paracoccus shanxieyensis]